MDQLSSSPHRLPIALLSGLAATGLAAAAFYGWLKYGSSMLLTLGEAGLPGCL